jgi:N-acyl amino acid synthase of PEP-CTERM/exosortase system
MDRKRLAEISRLVISKKMRRRKDDGLYYTPEYGDNRRSSDMDIMRRIKPMAFGLYREIYQECKRRGVTHLLALMEKTLWLLLKIHHFEFEQIGDTIHFYGPVAPYICYIEDAERNVYEKSPELYKYLVDGLEPQYLPRFVK